MRDSSGAWKAETADATRKGAAKPRATAVPVRRSGSPTPGRCQRVIVPDHRQIRRPCVRLDLFDTLAPRNRAGDGVVLKAPGDRPLGHAGTGRHLIAGDAFDLA